MGYSEISYEDIQTGKVVLQTGDIILFSGRALLSMFIRCFTGSPLSHAGIVAFHPHFPGIPFLIESVISRDSFHNYLRKGFQNGVRAVELLSRIKSYDGSVFLRTLENKSGDQEWIKDEKKRINDEIWNHIDLIRTCGYDHSFYSIEIAIDQNCVSFVKPGVPERFHCSSLVAYLLKKIDIIPPFVHETQYIPDTFMEEDATIGCINGWKYSEMFRINMPINRDIERTNL